MRIDYELRYVRREDTKASSVMVSCTEKQLPLVAKAIVRGENATCILAKRVSGRDGSPDFYYVP